MSDQAADRGRARLHAGLDLGLLVKKVVERAVEFLQEQRTQKESPIHQNVQQWVDDIISGLRNNDSWKKIVNEKVISVIGEVINRNHHLIGEMVEKNLSSLSPEQIKEQFRIRTYDDMQWIRVNGAVAGFAIGIVIGILRVLLF